MSFAREAPAVGQPEDAGRGAEGLERVLEGRHIVARHARALACRPRPASHTVTDSHYLFCKPLNVAPIDSDPCTLFALAHLF